MTTDYKESLNLPNTAFPMKANLAEREPEALQRWADIQLYERLKANAKGKPKFILADGPPYANGPIHIGHAVNKILKDFIIKSKIMSGFDAPYIPGWDCHGLPIELNVEKQIGKPGIKVDPKTFRKKCREYVLEQITLQRDAFVRLGVLGDFAHPYQTMDSQYEADIIRSLGKVASNGHLHKGFKPVHWCVECGSALAEAEVEYQNKISPSIDVIFKAEDDRFHSAFRQLPARDKSSAIAVVIWTTTPWTLPGNQAVALHPDYQYALVHFAAKPGYYLVAAELVPAFAKSIGCEEYQIMDTCKGSALEGFWLKHPLYDRKVPIVLGDHVTLDSGTGCVHTAPAHGVEDFAIGVKYGLTIESVVRGDGCYLVEVPRFSGEHVFKVNEKIIAALKEDGTLLHATKIDHSYPHCWRHKCPLIFRATQQWFISMEQNGLKKSALNGIQSVEWIPNWGQARMEGMVDRPDWCISRQRTWGVPMGLFLHRETGELHPRTLELIETVAKKIEQSGIDAWFDLSLEEILKEEAKDYEKSSDTLDVWFDSGVSHFCVLEKRPELGFPADLYLEGSDQHRGWFQSSLLTSIAMKGIPPFRQVLTHGFTVDAEGRKMSKSLGNVVLPEKVINTLGADVLRLWVAATDYRSEMAVSDTILKQTSDIYRRIRNTARFLLANLNGFDPAMHLIAPKELLILDQFIVERARVLQADIVQAYEEYQFHIVYQKVHHYCAVELGSFYLDIIKDRQYTGQRDGIPRRSAQTALYYIVEYLVRWIAPLLSFTAEEIWQYIPGKREDSVFLSGWYDKLPHFNFEHQKMNSLFWDSILTIRTEVNKALEEARAAGIIGSGLEAEVDLFCEASLYSELAQLGDELRFILITSRADIHPLEERHNKAKETAVSGLWIDVFSSSHAKCERCWHRREDINVNPQFPGICARCVDNVAGSGEQRQYA